MIDEQSADDQRGRRFGIEQMQERQRHGHKSHLPDRGIAEQTLRLGLREADQVGDDEGRAAEDGYDLGMILEERKQIVECKENTRRYAGRDEGRDAARGRFIDIEPPTVRRKWLQLKQQAREQEHQRGKPNRPLDGRAIGD